LTQIFDSDIRLGYRATPPDLPDRAGPGHPSPSPRHTRQAGARPRWAVGEAALKRSVGAAGGGGLG
jgi:hypothetical protein